MAKGDVETTLLPLEPAEGGEGAVKLHIDQLADQRTDLEHTGFLAKNAKGDKGRKEPPSQFQGDEIVG